MENQNNNEMANQLSVAETARKEWVKPEMVKLEVEGGRFQGMDGSQLGQATS